MSKFVENVLPEEPTVVAEPVVASLAPNDQDNTVPSLTWLYLYISGSCNLACRHCWLGPLYDPKGKSGDFIQLEHVKSAVTQAKLLGLQGVKLTGGEPTLHPQFRDLVEILYTEEIRPIMETNGILVDDDLAEFLVDHGLTHVSVSLDGVKPETHDFVRGVAGSYQQAVRGIKAFTKAGLRPQIICTLNQLNIHEVTEIINLAEECDASSLKLNVLQSAGRGEQFVQKYGLSVPEIIEFSRYVQTTLARQARIQIFVDVPIAFHTIDSLLSSLGLCGIFNILGVLSDGTLSMCGIGYSVPELVYGHLDREQLVDVWTNNPGLIELRSRIPQELEGICQNCIHRNLCKGNCIANNYYLSQSLTAPYIFCHQAETLGLFPESRKINE